MLRILLLMPSFYGLVFFGTNYVLYLANDGEYEDIALATHLVCVLVTLVFGLATLRSYPACARLAPELADRGFKRLELHPAFILLLHAIGLAGIAQYFRSLVAHFGSPLEVGLRLMSSSADIRIAADDLTDVGIGTQLSYFGWIAIWVTAVSERRGHVRWLLMVMSVIQILANLLYIDRTRPIWILFVWGLLVAIRHFRSLQTRRLLALAAGAVVGVVVVFVGAGAWIGKVDVSEVGNSANGLATAFQPLYIYLTSGFAFLNRMLLVDQPDFTLARSLYPVGTLVSHLGLVEPPPSQINEFLWTPLPTNVGTFLEPLYRDGGIALMVLGTLMHSFGFNWLGRLLIHNRAPLCLLAWAMLCFTDAIAFFTPKYTNTPTWLVLGLGVFVLLRARASGAESRQLKPRLVAKSG